jgi:glucokinase
MAHDALYMGIDIGGTKSAAILGDAQGNVLDRVEIPTADHSSTLAALVASASRLHGKTPAIACGISCGGPLSSREGLVLSPPNLPGWNRVPIVKVFQDALQIPTCLENDANAAALAEWHWGLHRQIDNLVYLTCGTGQGAGLILDGRLYRGKQDLAGEVGHVRLLPTGPVGYRKAGSVEGLTAAPALGRLAALRSIDHATAALSARDIGQAAIAGDTFAISVVHELARHLGHTCAIMLDIFNPERISLGTLAVHLGDLLLKEVRRTAREESLPDTYANCVIAPAVLAFRIQDCAALAVAAQVA